MNQWDFVKFTKGIDESPARHKLVYSSLAPRPTKDPDTTI